MSKTVKELADELGVSRQRVQQIISKQVTSKRPKKVAGQYLILPADETLIEREILGRYHANAQANSKQVADKLQASLQEEIATLKEQIHTKDRQIHSKDNQLEKMQKLLDQSQQLQLMAESKLESLDSPKEDTKEDDHDNLPMSDSEMPERANNERTEHIKWWQKLFK